MDSWFVYRILMERVWYCNIIGVYFFLFFCLGDNLFLWMIFKDFFFFCREVVGDVGCFKVIGDKWIVGFVLNGDVSFWFWCEELSVGSGVCVSGDCCVWWELFLFCWFNELNDLRRECIKVVWYGYL